MRKDKINLSVDRGIKQRAKRIARQRGMSISQFFEELVAREKDIEEYVPPTGSTAQRLLTLADEAQKKEHLNYDNIRHNALKEKHGI